MQNQMTLGSEKPKCYKEQANRYNLIKYQDKFEGMKKVSAKKQVLLHMQTK